MSARSGAENDLVNPVGLVARQRSRRNARRRLAGKIVRHGFQRADNDYLEKASRLHAVAYEVQPNCELLEGLESSRSQRWPVHRDDPETLRLESHPADHSCEVGSTIVSEVKWMIGVEIRTVLVDR